MNGHSTGGMTLLTFSYRCAVARSTSGVHSSEGAGSEVNRSRDGQRAAAGVLGKPGVPKSSGPNNPVSGIVNSLYARFEHIWRLRNPARGRCVTRLRLPVWPVILITSKTNITGL